MQCTKSSAIQCRKQMGSTNQNGFTKNSSSQTLLYTMAQPVRRTTCVVTQGPLIQWPLHMTCRSNERWSNCLQIHNINYTSRGEHAAKCAVLRRPTHLPKGQLQPSLLYTIQLKNQSLLSAFKPNIFIFTWVFHPLHGGSGKTTGPRLFGPKTAGPRCVHCVRKPVLRRTRPGARGYVPSRPGGRKVWSKLIWVEEVGARTLLGAPGITTRNKKLLVHTPGFLGGHQAVIRVFEKFLEQTREA